MRIKQTICILTLTFGMALPTYAASLNDLEKGQLDIKLVDTSGQDYIQAQGIFDAPVDKVWQTLTDFKNYPQYYQSVKKSELRAQTGNQAKVYVSFDFPFPVNDIWVLNQYTLDAQNKRLSWKMLDGNLKNSDGAGSWSLKSYKGKTLATYRLNVESSGAANWIQKQAIFQSTPAVFKYLNEKMK